MGWMLGHMFLMLTHKGRKSGQPRQTVLEVVGYDKATNTHYVAAAWGSQSDWFRNIQKNPQVRVSVAGKRYAARAEILSQSEALQLLLDYAKNHSFRFNSLSGLLVDQPKDSTVTQRAQQMAQIIPFVKLSHR